jgi:hypothetical protein
VKCWIAAAKGQNLRKLRNRADYGERIDGLAQEAKKALARADEIIVDVAGVTRT